MSKFRLLVKRFFPHLVYARNCWRAGTLRSRAYSDVFAGYYRANKWGDNESKSGPGSNLQGTAALREQLPVLCRAWNVRSFLDIPCGDFHWMQHVELGVEQYIGADIVPDLIRSNSDQYGNERRSFLRLDLVKDPLPEVDLIFCRDCLVHLNDKLIANAIANIRKSGSTYLLTTTFVNLQQNMDIVTGQWRPINLQRKPFNLPEPLTLIDEHAPAEIAVREGKRLGLWRINSL